MPTDLLAFLGIATIVIVTPGQDTALTIRSTLAGGRAAGIATAVGVATGQLGWTVAASFGLTALLLASEPVFNAWRIVGAAYLVFLGLQALRSAIRGVDADAGRTPEIRALRPRQAYRDGVISNLSNAKMAVFFTSLLPQFAPAGERAFLTMLALGFILATMTLWWLIGYVFVVARAGDVLRRRGVRRALDAILGGVLIALGVRVALTER